MSKKRLNLGKPLDNESVRALSIFGKAYDKRYDGSGEADSLTPEILERLVKSRRSEAGGKRPRR